MKVERLAAALHLPKHICNHLIGHDHSKGHRMVAGVVVMGIGVAIAKSGGEIHLFMIHYVADMVGYLVHGIGCLPFVEHLLDEEKA